jgi:hypothetical protein
MKKSGKPGVRMTLRGFRETKKPLSGDVYVVGRSPRHKGVPKPVNAATDASRKGQAASDDGSAATAGGDATTSVATAASRDAYAEAANPMAKQAKGTPKVAAKQSKKKGKKGSTRGEKDKPSAPAARTKASDGREKPQTTNALWDWRMDLGGGPEFPRSGREYVEAVNAKIDLVTLAQIQLKSPDEKLSGRLLEQLLKIAFLNVDDAPAEAYERISANVPG